MQATYVRQSAANGTGLTESMPPGGRPEVGYERVRRRLGVAKGKTPGNGNGANDRGLVEALVNSRIYQDYERAFSEATGLPVALRPVESWQLPHHDKRNESPFCRLMAEKSRACSACLQVQEALSEKATQEPHTVSCPVGMCDTAVPVRLG